MVDVYSEPDEATQVERPIEGTLSVYRTTLSRDCCHLLSHYRYIPLAGKIVGVASVCTRCGAALFVGEHSDVVLFLSVKDARISVRATSPMGLSPISPRSYAKQIERDHQALLGAVTSDAIAAESGS